MMDSRGLVSELVWALVILMVVGFVYWGFTPAVESAGTELNEEIENAEFRSTGSTVMWVWRAWPLVVVVAVLVWIFYAATRKAPWAWAQG